MSRPTACEKGFMVHTAVEEKYQCATRITYRISFGLDAGLRLNLSLED